MLGISDQNIIEEGSLDEIPEYDADRVVTIRYSRIDPFFCRDGIDEVRVVRRRGCRYLVEYRGFVAGYLETTDTGVEKLVDDLLADQPDIPYWTVTTVPERLPEWLSTEYTSPDPVTCRRCDRDVPPKDIVTPGGTTDRFCRDCWNDYLGG